VTTNREYAVSHYNPQGQSNLNARYVRDLIERVVVTFLEAFLALWLGPVAADILNGGQTLGTVWEHLSDLSVLDKAAVGGLAAVIATFKGLLARSVGSANTAALLPAQSETPDP
jgi:hypothetical protein